MPEVPEVKIVGEFLAKNISGKRLTAVEVLSGRYTKKKIDGIEHLEDEFPVEIVGPGVHGKFIFWITKSDVFLYNTLGMTGWWSLSEAKSSRVLFRFEGLDLYFNDTRNFGTLKMVKGKGNLISKIQSLGPDMLSSDVTSNLFVERLREKSSWEITKALMSQSVVAGVGNYIKSESLWRTSINPRSRVCDLDDDTLADLCDNIKKIMNESYESQTLEGKKYEMDVYGKKVDAMGNDVLKEKTDDGRTTYWCPEKQIKGVM